MFWQALKNATKNEFFLHERTTHLCLQWSKYLWQKRCDKMIKAFFKWMEQFYLQLQQNLKQDHYKICAHESALDFWYNLMRFAVLSIIRFMLKGDMKTENQQGLFSPFPFILWSLEYVGLTRNTSTSHIIDHPVIIVLSISLSSGKKKKKNPLLLHSSMKLVLPFPLCIPLQLFW